jgi:hypothetical protein
LLHHCVEPQSLSAEHWQRLFAGQVLPLAPNAHWAQPPTLQLAAAQTPLLAILVVQMPPPPLAAQYSFESQSASLLQPQVVPPTQRGVLPLQVAQPLPHAASTLQTAHTSLPLQKLPLPQSPSQRSPLPQGPPLEQAVQAPPGGLRQ